MDAILILALIGVALWVAGLAWLVFSDVIHSAQRHHVHVPHPHLHSPSRHRGSDR